MGSVSHFECRGSSKSNAKSGRSHGLDVCLERSQIESVIESRPGGTEYLSSEQRVTQLLGKARRYNLDGAKDGRPLYIVKFEESELNEIKRVITSAKLEVKTISSKTVTEAIMMSFIVDEIVPPKKQCYLAKASLDYLKENIGFDINEDFEVTLADMVEHTHHVAWCLANGRAQWYLSRGWSFSFTYEIYHAGAYDGIEIDCLQLLNRFLEERKVCPIEIGQLVDAIPSIVWYLNGAVEYRVEALSILKNILARGTKEHKQKIVGVQTIQSFLRFMSSSKESDIGDSVASLRQIAIDGNVDHRRNIIYKGCDKLIGLLDTNYSLRINNDSLAVLTASRPYLGKEQREKTLPDLCRIIKLRQDDTLANCLILLRDIIEDNDPPIQKVVATGVVSTLVDVINGKHDQFVQINLAHIMLGLANVTDEEQSASLTAQREFLSVLVSLQDSSCDEIADKAASSLHRIANNAVSWTNWKDKTSLGWGEFEVGVLVDSDCEEESDGYGSSEEAEEVSDEQLRLELEQAQVATAKQEGVAISINFDNMNKCADGSPSLMGMSDKMTEIILSYLHVGEVVLMEGVCKRFRKMAENDDLWTRLIMMTPLWAGLRNIRKYQLSTYKEGLLSVLCEKIENRGLVSAFIENNELINDPEPLRNVCHCLLSKMKYMDAESNSASFRLRGDTVSYLAELIQGYMIQFLQKALCSAVHCGRAEVQKDDIALVTKEFHSFESCYSSQQQLKCDISEEHHGNIAALDCSCSIPSKSGIVWRWPADDCHDVLPPEAGRRIIRMLSYMAGINKMSSDAFVLAEAELLHTMGVLLADAYESSIEQAKSAYFLDADETVVYRMAMSNEPPPMSSNCIDMFKVPPPPLIAARGDTMETEDFNDTMLDTPKGITHTIVPGQLVVAAERRGITPNNVYGDGWVASKGLSEEEEREIEASYYYNSMARALLKASREFFQ